MHFLICSHRTLVLQVVGTLFVPLILQVVGTLFVHSFLPTNYSFCARTFSTHNKDKTEMRTSYPYFNMHLSLNQIKLHLMVYGGTDS